MTIALAVGVLIAGLICLLVAATGAQVNLVGVSFTRAGDFSARDRLAFGAVGAALVAVAVYIAHEAVSPSPVPGRQVLHLAPLLVAEPVSHCFGGTGNLVLGGGVPTFDDIVSCNWTQVPDGQTQQYDFKMPALAAPISVTAVLGKFGIDEAGDVDQHTASAAWTIAYNGQTLCQVVASWGKPGACELTSPVVITTGSSLKIREHFYNRNPAEHLKVYAGIAAPALQYVQVGAG